MSAAVRSTSLATMPAGRDDRQLVPGLGQRQRRARHPSSWRPRRAARRACPAAPRRAITASAEQTLPRSMPGSRSRCGRARWKPSAGRLRARGQDHHVGAEGAHLVGVHRRVEPDHDLHPGQLALLPVEIVQDLLAARLHPGEPELAAQPVGRLDQRHLMARVRRPPARLPARPARRPPPAPAWVPRRG